MIGQNAFGRAKSMMAAVAAAMGLPVHMQQAALAGIGPYVSRGKGGNFSAIGRKGGHMQAVRASKKAANVKRHRKASR